MKQFVLFTLLSMFSLLSLNAQDATWFTDVTEDVKLNDVSAWRLYVSDVNGDHYPDLMIVNGIYKRNQLSLYLNVQDPNSNDPSDRIFTDITEYSGINANPIDTIDGRVADVGALADIDNDGDVDLVTGRFYYQKADHKLTEDRAEVLLNDGTGSFTLVPDNGIRSWNLLNATGMTFLDYDNDGNLDLYIGTFSWDHARSSYMSDVLMKGNGDGTFTDMSRPSGIENVPQPLYGVSAFDWNNDGLQDVITGPYCRTGGSLWMNNGDGTFSDVAGPVGYSAQHSGGDNGQRLCQWEAMPADFDNDGDVDILQVLVHGGYHAGEGRSVIAVNQGAENNYALEWDLQRIRRDAPLSSHLGDMSGSWIDLNNDGLLDLVINQSQYPQANGVGVERSYFLLQNDSNYFDEITDDLGLRGLLNEPGASEVIDFDLDGDDDLLLVKETKSNRQNSLVILENNVGNQNNWIGVKLKAPASVNRDAIGARISVTAGGVTQIREVHAGNGHFGGQQPLTQNIGIGNETEIERIEVRWPSSTLDVTVVENPPINQIITIEESGVSNIIICKFGDEGFEISPNPARSSIRIQLPHSFGGKGTLKIFNVIGEQLKKTSISSADQPRVVDLDDFAAGYYTVTITDQDGVTFSKPFVVQ